MLDDHERRTLEELERQFMTDDVEFSRSFGARAQRLDRKHRGVGATVVVVFAVVVCTLMVAAGSPGGALGFAAVTGVIWLAWWGSRRRHDGPTRP